MAAESTTAEVLSKRGDVILHIGEAPRVERKLLVSSVLLGHVSPVFAAMFDGRFAEGQALTPTAPRVVPLPQDDAEATTIICKIIHTQVADLSLAITPTQLADIAVVCHKYDCVDAVKAWGIIWIAALIRDTSAAGYEKLLFATYLLDLAPEFKSVSRSFIVNCAEPLSISAMMNGYDFLPVRLLERIVKEQHDTQMRALAALDPIIPATGSACKNLQNDCDAFMKELRAARLWPLCTISVEVLMNRLARIPDTTFSRERCYPSECPCKTDTRHSGRTLAATVRDVYRSAKGLCLDCVKREETDVGRRTCREDCAGDNSLTCD